MKKLPNIKEISIVKKLAEGGQGEVFLVRNQGRECVLKLYTSQRSTEVQREIIRHLVESGVPAEKYAHRFAWPTALVDVPEEKRFGYLMPWIDTSRFISLVDIEAGRVRHPGYGIMTEAGRQLAECFRELHIDGYCYRDISKNNFMFSPESGGVVICDNDNIAIDREDAGNILGTPQFMAPEVILGKARPSTVTDQHSLAVLLFMLLCGGGHPFHGRMEYGIKIFDGVASRYIYGEKPVFVFDPADQSNRLPDEPGYRHVAVHWKVLPYHIRSLFVRAFTDGLKNPSLRVTDMEWKNALTQLLGQRDICRCGAENFWDPDRKDRQVCWHKGCTVAFPQKLHIKGKSVSAMLVKAGQQITSLHLGEKSSAVVLGEMETHPSDTSLVLLRNKTGETWNALFGNQQVDIPAGRAIPLHPGLAIKAAAYQFTVSP